MAGPLGARAARGRRARPATLCMLLHTPIPWMLGPLFALALLRVAGCDVAAPRPARYVGQWIIGTSLGLYFTPYVVHEVAGLWYLLVAGAVFAIALGYGSGVALARLARPRPDDRHLRERARRRRRDGDARRALRRAHGSHRRGAEPAHPDRRAIVPGAITALGIHGTDPYVQGATRSSRRGFALLMAATLAGSARRQWLRMPNAFVLGSLAVAIPLTALRSTCRRCRRSRRTRGNACSAARSARASSRTSCAARTGSSARSRRRVLAVDRAVGGVRRGARVAGRAASGDAGARQRAGRHRRDVHHREGAAARRAARHGVPRDAAGRAAARDGAVFVRARRWYRARREARRSMSWNPQQYLEFADQRLRPRSTSSRASRRARRAPSSTWAAARATSRGFSRERWPGARDRRHRQLGGDAREGARGGAGERAHRVASRRDLARVGAATRRRRRRLQQRGAALARDHATLFPRAHARTVARGRRAGRADAAQFRAPSHVAIARGRDERALARAARRAACAPAPVRRAEQYFRWLAPHARRVDVVDDRIPARAAAARRRRAPVVAWMKGTWLAPFFAALDAGRAARVRRRLRASGSRAAYPPRARRARAVPVPARCSSSRRARSGKATGPRAACARRRSDATRRGVESPVTATRRDRPRAPSPSVPHGPA